MTREAGIVLYLNNIAQSSLVLRDATSFLATYLPWIAGLSVCFWIVCSSYSLREKIFISALTISSYVIARFGVAEAIRFFYQRPRPYLEYSDINAIFYVNQWSFPSGHATIFFSIATTMFFFNKKLGVGLFVAAIFISLGRVAAGVHYPTDILGGMAIGIGVSSLLFLVTKRKGNVL